MAGGMRRRAACLAVVAAMLWTALAMAQINETSPLPSSTSTPEMSLPDAPSARPPVTETAENRPQVQSWWLVSPENAPYRPLSSHEKFMSFVHHAYSPYTFGGSLYDASWAQMWGDPKEYDGGMEGFGKRFGASVAGTESRSFFGSFLFPTLLHQDPRYFAMNKGSVKKRAWHALSRVFVTRNDDGDNVFNSSGILAIAFTESLKMAWAPEGQRSGGNLANCVLGSLQGDASYFVLREFTPDMLRFFKRHAPKPLRRIEEKLPPQITGDTGQP